MPKVFDEEARWYRRGSPSDRARLDGLLNELAVNLSDRSAAWQKSGWKTFDPSRKPYDAEVRKERQLYAGGLCQVVT